jgi:predicted nucleic acid-binding protein
VVDSSFVFEALLDSGTGRHADSKSFAERLRNENSVLVYSSLIFLEAPQCWRRLYRRGSLVPGQRGIDQVADRQNAFAEADAQLARFLSTYSTRRVQISRKLLSLASTMAATYNLSSHDALIVAISWYSGVVDIAALDQGFQDVDGIELWDNLF